MARAHTQENTELLNHRARIIEDGGFSVPYCIQSVGHYAERIEVLRLFLNYYYNYLIE